MRLLAWAGGAAFAASLAGLVYFYAIVLASPAGDPALTVRNALLDTALFSAFALHHSLLARSAAKARITRVVPHRFQRSLYVWIASLLLAGVCLLWQPVAGMLYRVDGWWRVPFWSLQLCGAYLTVRSAGVIDPLELAGIRQVEEPAARDTVQAVGPFRFVRHPIYLGWMMMVFLTPTMTANRLLFAVISSAYLLLAIPWEERSLVAAHGDQYRAYRQSVRWRIIPGLW